MRAGRPEHGCGLRAPHAPIEHHRARRALDPRPGGLDYAGVATGRAEEAISEPKVVARRRERDRVRRVHRAAVVRHPLELRPVPAADEPRSRLGPRGVRARDGDPEPALGAVAAVRRRDRGQVGHGAHHRRRRPALHRRRLSDVDHQQPAGAVLQRRSPGRSGPERDRLRRGPGRGRAQRAGRAPLGRARHHHRAWARSASSCCRRSARRSCRPTAGRARWRCWRSARSRCCSRRAACAAGWRPQARASRPSARRSPRPASTPAILYLTAGFFVCGWHVAFIAVHLPAYLADGGISTEIAAWCLALVGLFNVIGSYAAGVLGGRLSKKYCLSFLYAARAVVILAFIVLPLQRRLGARLLRDHGPALAQHRAADLGPGRPDLRPALHGDPVRDRVPQPSGRQFPWRSGSAATCTTPTAATI